MSSFADLVTPIVGARPGLDASAALAVIGPEARAALPSLDAATRAALVDRFVRNLRGLSVHDATALERQLLRVLGAEPRGTYRWSLESSRALVELRGGLRYLCAWLGLPWHELSRLQAVIGGAARWIHASGQGVVEATVEPAAVRFEIDFEVRGLDAKQVPTSPLVLAIREQTEGFVATEQAGRIRLQFTLKARP